MAPGPASRPRPRSSSTTFRSTCGWGRQEDQGPAAHAVHSTTAAAVAAAVVAAAVAVAVAVTAAVAYLRLRGDAEKCPADAVCRGLVASHPEDGHLGFELGV